MVAEEFNPVDHAREPREEGWKEETEEIFEHIRNRGDLRIGQLIINAVSRDIDFPDHPHKGEDVQDLEEDELREYIEESKQHEAKCKARIERRIWSMEADKLLKLLDEFNNEASTNDEK